MWYVLLIYQRHTLPGTPRHFSRNDKIVANPDDKSSATGTKSTFSAMKSSAYLRPFLLEKEGISKMNFTVITPQLVDEAQVNFGVKDCSNRARGSVAAL